MVLIGSAAWQPARPALEVAADERLRRIVVPLVLRRRRARAARLRLRRRRSTRSPSGSPPRRCVAVMARTMLTFRDNVAMLRASREEAQTDALTGLGNRRALARVLERELPRATTRRAARARAVRPRRLQALQRHVRPPGRRRAARAARRQPRRVPATAAAPRSAWAATSSARCSRPAAASAEPLVVGAAAALSEHGEGFEIGCSYGAIELPARGRRRRRGAADRRPAHVRAEERRPHVGQPPEQGRAAARARRAQPGAARPPQRRRRPRRGDRAAARAQPRDVEQVRHAAELHDVGKVAVPDAILTKPGPLDEDEWAFIRRHTLIGERIIAAAPALTRVAALVRSSHERWDGDGYPDGLAGEEIPLGARIVAVADAFDAMTSPRPYSLPRTPEAALEELRRCAGTPVRPGGRRGVRSRLAGPPVAAAADELSRFCLLAGRNRYRLLHEHRRFMLLLDTRQKRKYGRRAERRGRRASAPVRERERWDRAVCSSAARSLWSLVPRCCWRVRGSRPHRCAGHDWLRPTAPLAPLADGRGAAGSCPDLHRDDAVPAHRGDRAGDAEAPAPRSRPPGSRRRCTRGLCDLHPTRASRAYDAIVMFQTSGDPWTGRREGGARALPGVRQAASRRSTTRPTCAATSRGGTASSARSCPATRPPGRSPGLPGEIIVEDRAHPSTRHLDGHPLGARRTSGTTSRPNVRGNAHVLLSMDESTYAPGGNAMGYDHPIAWCKPYDGGRALVTALGHFGAHYDEPALLEHIVGGVQYAAGLRGRRLRRHDQRQLREGHARRQHERAVRARRRARRPRLLHRARPRPDPRLRPGRPATSRRRSRSTSTRAARTACSASPSTRTSRPTASSTSTTRPQSADNNNPANWFSRVSRFTVGRGRHDRPGVREADHRDPRQPRLRRARPHRRRPGLRPRRQPADRRRRRRQPALRAVRRLRAALRAHDRPAPARRPRDVGQHERPARQAAAHHAEPHRRRRLHDPGGQPVPGGGGHRRTRRGPRSTRWASATRSASPSTRTPAGSASPTTRRTPAPTAPANRGPAGIVEYNLIKAARQLRLAAVHRAEQRPGPGPADVDVPRRRDRRGTTRRRLLRLRQPGQRLPLQHRPAPTCRRRRRRSCTTATRSLDGPGGDPGRRRPRADGRPVLRLRPGPGVRREVPGVLRRQAVLLRVVQEPHLLDDRSTTRARSSRRSTASCRPSRSSRRRT